MEILKKGTPVRLMQPEIAGKVVDVRLTDAGAEYLVEYARMNGEAHIRHFPADRLVAVGANAEAIDQEVKS